MYEVEVTAGFSAAHRLRDYKGKCEKLHGHNYRVMIVARTNELSPGGMVIDFVELKKVAGATLERLDHSFLNDLEPFDRIEPSAENIAAFLFQEIARGLGDRGGLLHSVSVWESDTSRAAFIRDEAP
ncbi:MAG: 6-carboxytetrahydropterin synthase QueD [Deltaproteobacteria bacterium]|nr:6-carboxytetrahydropterin synthase QueD [Deltaproteobacteria bacterium]